MDSTASGTTGKLYQRRGFRLNGPLIMLFPVRGPLKNDFTFCHPIFAPSSAAPQSQILEIAGLFLRSAQSVRTESDANLGANSAKLLLSGP